MEARQEIGNIFCLNFQQMTCWYKLKDVTKTQALAKDQDRLPLSSYKIWSRKNAPANQLVLD